MNFHALAVIAVAGISGFMLSCSFNYGNDVAGNDTLPDMTMSAVSASRYEDAKLSLTASAGKLEMYDEDQIWAGEDVSFMQYDPDEPTKLQAEGTAGLLLVNNKDKVYSLGNGVAFQFVPDELTVEAQNLQWNKQAHILRGSLTEEVEIRKENGSIIKGTGFFADTLSRFYEFEQTTSGILSSDDEKETSADTNSDNNEESAAPEQDEQAKVMPVNGADQ